MFRSLDSLQFFLGHSIDLTQVKVPRLLVDDFWQGQRLSRVVSKKFTLSPSIKECAPTNKNNIVTRSVSPAVLLCVI